MKNTLLSATLITSVMAFPATANAFVTTMLKAYESPYPATISLQDVGRALSGRRAIVYRISISTSGCAATLEGRAEFFSQVDEQLDNSAFLRNGDVVKTNIFKGTGPDGDITITMDVESSRPKYADVVIDQRSAVADGCFRNGKMEILFF
ncbi:MULTISPECIES: hypothetical protein [unclassified Paraburkholderia]|uniref:hypothetical protein n=1 Tax=unclassified Paraburkholderia TaxID=2615204 RepID=UPI0016074FCF|nr:MULTISPECIES: hypothetical protein [unclassified Paraburkholderia]MBB5447158.1 hypothetical protein [Paraburkholderia sp. WSM4177]MBB5487737.1 hypothetical protein [Paraburkholderia sp. WSM4180]